MSNSIQSSPSNTTLVEQTEKAITRIEDIEDKLRVLPYLNEVYDYIYLNRSYDSSTKNKLIHHYFGKSMMTFYRDDIGLKILITELGFRKSRFDIDNMDPSDNERYGFDIVFEGNLKNLFTKMIHLKALEQERETLLVSLRTVCFKIHDMINH